jgi:hypothetical protein
VTDISHRFSLSQIDHHELLEILTLRHVTCWRVSEDKILFPAFHDYRLQLKMRHGQIKKISASESLSEQELNELLEQVEADLKDSRIAEYGAEILFARRPVTGAFRFTSIPMQILPPPPEAPLPPNMSADHPFVLEYPLQCSQTPQVRYLRRRKNAVEWAWVLNALLYGSIKYSGSRTRQMWAIQSRQSNLCLFGRRSSIRFRAFGHLQMPCRHKAILCLLVPQTRTLAKGKRGLIFPSICSFCPTISTYLLARF